MDKFKEILEKAASVLIITHVGPDPDAFCSLLLTGTTLEANYPDKKIVMSSEEQTGGLNFLTGYGKIKLQKLADAIQNDQPDLIIMVDAMNFKRCTRGDDQEIAKLVKEKRIKLAIIDHHERVNIEENNVYINQDSPAAVQDVYEVMFSGIKLNKPVGYAQTTMLGLYSDTGGFAYENKRYRDTLKLVGDLIEAGASVEKTRNLLDRYSTDSMLALSELARNLSHKDDYSFSFVGDDFTKNWQNQGKNFDELKIACGHFANDYIRNIDGRVWGFVVYKDLAGGDDIYGVSLRAMGGTKNVALIANALGGGGHIAAAGTKIKASSVQEVIKAVQSTISQM
ncbi:MAG TPA: DHH family phosphoesterase [Candidatus Saccharimonadales bacterium]|nr:DHH family phosphoesterase [Candidatus Saccharimonadales bacterium]